MLRIRDRIVTFYSMLLYHVFNVVFVSVTSVSSDAIFYFSVYDDADGGHGEAEGIGQSSLWLTLEYEWLTVNIFYFFEVVGLDHWEAVLV